MEIIQIQENENGSRPPIQTWQYEEVPEGFCAIECDTSVFYDFRGFVHLTIKDGVCTEITGNQEALDAYLADHPDLPEPEPTPTLDSRVSVLEETSATKDEIQAVWDSMAEAYSEGVQMA